MDDGRPIAWFHNCPRDGPHFVGIREACNWCGRIQSAEPHRDAAQVDQL
jgi:hypothetical protein